MPGDGGAAQITARRLRGAEAAETLVRRFLAGTRITGAPDQPAQETDRACAALLVRAGARPSLVYPLTAAVGFALGAGAALAGPRLTAAAHEGLIQAVIARQDAGPERRLDDDSPDPAEALDALAERLEDSALAGQDPDAETAPAAAGRLDDAASQIVKLAAGRLLAVAARV